MTNIEQRQNVPQLRFPEFDGEWDKLIIQNIANKITDGTHDTPKPTETGIPFLTAIHVRDGFIDFDNCYYLPEEVHKKIYSRCNPEKDDLLMVNIGAGVATSAKVDVDFEFSLKNVALIKPNQTKIDPDFFTQIQRRNSARLRHQISAGGAQPFLSLKEIGKLKLIIPKEKIEQTKIANFLTAVDKRITLLQKKKAELEQYKKGIMQKLFSQEIRFKKDDGGDFADWEEKRLGKVCEKKSSNISANTLSENNGVYKIYGATGFLQNIDFYREEEPYISIVKDGAGVGRTLLCEAKSSVLGTLDIIKPKGENHLEFLYTLINQIHFYKYITGSTIPHIYFRDYSKERINIPTPKEQQKIANFLSSIDKSIENVGKQIEQSQQWKKGLLQKMFV